MTLSLVVLSLRIFASILIRKLTTQFVRSVIVAYQYKYEIAKNFANYTLPIKIIAYK